MVPRNGPSGEGASGRSNEPSNSLDFTRATTRSQGGVEVTLADTRTGCQATVGAATASSDSFTFAFSSRSLRTLSEAIRHAARTFGD